VKLHAQVKDKMTRFMAEADRILQNKGALAMTRDRAIAAAEAYFDEGGFTEDLARRVAIPSESQVPERASMLARYLDGEIAPSLQRLGFATETVANPAGAGPMLIAERREPGNRTSVLGYSHGDVIRGLEAEWAEGLSPWRGDRLYGRGTADNKGQHTINFAALDAVLKIRGRLGFDIVYLIASTHNAPLADRRPTRTHAGKRRIFARQRG
jgi:acetylornithine deacetylase/succinyl-diaminopimelate desuccinylase-like protein